MVYQFESVYPEISGRDFTVLERGDLVKEFAPPHTMIVQLDYTGSSVGFISVCVDQAFSDGEGDATSGLLKEVLNTCSGQMLDILKPVCPVITLLSPKVIMGKVDYPAVNCLSQTLVTSAGRLYFSVAIDQRSLDIEILLKETQEMSRKLEKTRKDLVQAEKMASMGELVAGVAHEVNTPLGVGVTGISHISEQVDFLFDKFNEGRMKRSDLQNFLEDCREEVRLIYGNLIRASRLIENFKKVAMDQHAEESREIFLIPYIRELVYSLSYLWSGKDIEMRVGGDDVLKMKTFPGVLTQVITHLITNSIRHGLEGRKDGKIFIEAVKSDTGGGVMLTFMDNGVGMSSEVMAKVFDPFFTTKRGRGGTGLGMHIVFNLVTQKLNGKIHCESEEGRGSSFVMEFDQG